MTNLFIKIEEEIIPEPIDIPDLQFIGYVSSDVTIKYPREIHIERIKSTTGSSRKTGKRIYPVSELNKIIAGVFNTKISGNKEAKKNFLLLPENIRIIKRHNERVLEMIRSQGLLKTF